MDKMNSESVAQSYFETITFPDSSAITVKNITVRLKNVQLNLYLMFLIILES